MNLSECRYFIKMQHVKPHHPQAHSRAHTFDVGLPTYANALKAQDQTFTRLYLAVGCASVTPLIFTSLRPVKIKGVTEARACTALQHLPPPLPRQVAYVGWYTWLIRTPANLSVTLRSSNARSQCSETCQFRVRTPDFGSQVANFFFLLRRRRVAPVARHHGIGLVILTPARPSVALGSRKNLQVSISTS